MLGDGHRLLRRRLVAPTAGSLSARAAATRSSAVGGGDGALAQHARLGAGEVEHGRGRSRQLAAVDDRRGAGAELRAARPRGGADRAAGQVRARRGDCADALEDLAAGAVERRARGRRSSRVARPSASGSGRAGFGSTSVYGPGSSARAIVPLAAAQLGDALEEQRRGRRRRAPSAATSSRPFSAVEPADGLLAVRRRSRGRRRCRSGATTSRPPAIARRPPPRRPAHGPLDDPVAPGQVVGDARRSRSRARASRRGDRAPPGRRPPRARARRPARRRPAAPRATASVAPAADERDVRLPVADVRHQRLELVRLDVGRVRDDEVARAAPGGSRETSLRSSVDRRGRCARRSRARARARPPRRRSRSRGRPGARRRSRGRSRRCRCRRRARRGASSPRAARGTARRRSPSPAAGSARARRR